jgi:hypothetical protein
MTKNDGKTPMRTLVEIGAMYRDQKRKEVKGNPVKLMEIEAQFVAEDRAKLEEMMLRILDKHKIPRDLPEKWFYLACILALDSNKLFRRPKERPKKTKKWTDDWCADLSYHFVIYRFAMAAEKGVDVSKIRMIAVCRRLLKEYPGRWNSGERGRTSREEAERQAHSLQNRLNEARLRPSVQRLAEEWFGQWQKEQRLRRTEK